MEGSFEPFAITGLISRGGRSNWVFFFFPDRVSMIDVGMAPAVVAGLGAGVLSQFGAAGSSLLRRMSYGPDGAGHDRLADWHSELLAKAKTRIDLELAQVRSVRLRLRMLAHELSVADAQEEKTFGLMNRKLAGASVEPLRQLFKERFEVEKTPAFAFFERRLPFLL